MSITDRFATLYGRSPDTAWRAPGRVNLIGEHTDYNDGLVLPFATGMGVTVAAARRDDGVLELASRQAGAGVVSARTADLAPGSVTGWAAYPAGVAWALREHGVGGASVLVDADLPQGAGLSSSAALECATALALCELHGVTIDRRDLAGICQAAENRFVGVPCGIMDQSASLLCTAGHALLLDCRTGGSEHVPLPLGGLAALVVDTRAPHALTGADYGDRRAECERAAALLGVPALRDVDDLDGALRALPDAMLRRRVRHVVTENGRVERAVELLRATARPGKELGAVLTGSHTSLRDDYEVSWPQADVAVTAALQAGAHGGRMVGGGFGGSVLLLADTGRTAEVITAVTKSFAERGWQAPHVHTAVPSAGASRLL
ncbi:galactokinase [Actinomadura hibisca]|uniref:galactokinase n=1 Tax=Actinomadura hibisca TaxID=68565 RepID=UPI000832A010|nr:galactokinase [Actinomadura hibisca]